jgi:tetratricopeptide (TPR) repeat protein
MLWIPATLAIESTIIPLEMVFEHRMYLPSVGIFGLLSLPIASAFSGIRRSRVAVGVTSVLALILLGSATTRYLAVWRDPVVLAEHTTRSAPRSARAWSNLALAYLEVGRREAAADALRTSMSFDPDDLHNVELMGLILFDRGQLADARAQFNRALAVTPMSPSLLNHLGEVEFAEGAHEKAAALFQRAATLKPWAPSYHWNRALALEGLERCAEARREWQTYLELSSDARGKAEVEKHLREVHSAPRGLCPSQP